MIKEKEINGRKFYLVARSWSNSNGWGHECDLYWGTDRIVQHSRIKYYNRTWERWQYQSVMIQCLESYIQKEKDWHMNYYKDKNNIKRMTVQKRAEFDKWFEEQGACAVLKSLERWKKELM